MHACVFAGEAQTASQESIPSHGIKGEAVAWSQKRGMLNPQSFKHLLCQSNSSLGYQTGYIPSLDEFHEWVKAAELAHSCNQENFARTCSRQRRMGRFEFGRKSFQWKLEPLKNRTLSQASGFFIDGQEEAGNYLPSDMGGGKIPGEVTKVP